MIKLIRPNLTLPEILKKGMIKSGIITFRGSIFQAVSGRLYEGWVFLADSRMVRGKMQGYHEEERGARLKNHTDVLIFQLRVCAGATNSKLQSQI